MESAGLFLARAEKSDVESLNAAPAGAQAPELQSARITSDATSRVSLASTHSQTEAQTRARFPGNHEVVDIERNSVDSAGHESSNIASISTRNPELLDGYPSFAGLISQDTDGEVYRKFGALSARNLLYLQSELHELEGELNELDRQDAQKYDSEVRCVANNWKKYSRSETAGAKKHREVQGKIRVKLKEYHEALLLQNKVLTLNKPSKITLRALRDWYSWGASSVLTGDDEDLFDDRNDLIALKPTVDEPTDIFLRKIVDLMFRHDWIRNTDVSGRPINGVPESLLAFISALITVLFCTLLLVGAILSLSAIPEGKQSLRLGLIVLFMCLFAGAVGLLTTAKRAEIFASTAAYAAVLVIFVGTGPGTAGAM